MSGFNDRLVWFGLHEKAGVSVTPEHIHPHGVKELTAQSSYLIHVVSFPLDQYCLYKGSDLSVMALPTNWLSRGAGGVSLRATFCYNTSSMNKRKCPPTPHPLYIISPILGGNWCELGAQAKIKTLIVCSWVDWSIVLFPTPPPPPPRAFHPIPILSTATAYLSEHVGHGHCAVGVINGVMQHPGPLHPRPLQNHTRSTQPNPTRPNPTFLFVFPPWIMSRPTCSATMFLKLQP